MLLLSKRNLKQFWKQVKANKNQSSLPNLDFYDHFKELFSRTSCLGDDAKTEMESGLDYNRTVDFWINILQ